jgi:multidrug efflux pump
MMVSVDDAIVMIQNISHYNEVVDFSPGSEQNITPTVSSIAILIPPLFMREVFRRLFREFAITFAVSMVVCRGGIELFPQMCTKILHHRNPSEMSVARARTSSGFDVLIARSGRLLNRMLDRQPKKPLTSIIYLGFDRAG